MMKRTTAQSEPEIDFRRLRRRDREEVVRWFDAYSDPVYGFIFYRVGRDADLAGDVAQETFVTALETIDRFDPDRGEMFPWLTHIARNCIRKALRRRGRDNALPDFWKTVDQKLTRAITGIGSNSFPEELLAQKETAELVRMALTNLPLRYQTALRRHYFEELSLHEIAALEGVNEGAVKVLLHRARLAFRTAFETISASILDRQGKGRVIL
ncbi:MAG: sigma-70 family RNA polymerase sigma factor [Acidobacteria bacterium]|nr:sigma-70 family RNA polymerase sigma factor [Acidobacteriota bacterium]